MLTRCGHEHPIKIDVDRVSETAGLRLRHTPGWACLQCGYCDGPPIKPAESLASIIEKLSAGAPSDLVVLKGTRRQVAGYGEHCTICDGVCDPSVLDVAIGHASGLVVENVDGLWCETCRSVRFPDAGESIRDRIRRFDASADLRFTPSIVYDTPGHPTSVQLEVTTRCNLKCDYCSHKLLQTKEHVSLDELRPVLDNIEWPVVQNVDLTGLGEPFLHPHLPDIVAEIRHRGRPRHIRVVTNGTVLIPKLFVPLCDAGITSIAVSIDSLDPDTFARARRGGSLPSVLNNLETLVRHRGEHRLDHLNIMIKSVLLSNPYEEAERLLTYSARVGLAMPHFSCLDRRQNAVDQYSLRFEGANWAEDEGFAFAAWAGRRWKALTGSAPDVETDQARDGLGTMEFRNRLLLRDALACRWALDACFVTASGDCIPCCEQMIDLPRPLIASVRTNRLRDLWNGPLLWKYRLPLISGFVPKGCAGCPWAPRDGAAISEVAPHSGQTIRLV